MNILEAFPSLDEFYKTYWNKKAFLVRGGVPKELFEDELIDGDTLAALSCEEDICARLVSMDQKTKEWTCEHGPFAEEKFANLADNHWSLLVQNVEQFHPPTATLLQHFSFTPRWLMDDVMVSYSASGGGVGPHTDSYHVFLVQGVGERVWKVGTAPLSKGEQNCIAHEDLKILDKDFDGIEANVQMGDVIYIPPHVAHEGRTLKDAMTFSVGFLGPKMSELMMAYGAYLEVHEDIDTRYSGAQLTGDDRGFVIGKDAVNAVRENCFDALKSDHFAKWIVQFFAATGEDDDLQNMSDEFEHDDGFHAEDILGEIDDMFTEGGVLTKLDYIKIVLTEHSNGKYTIASMGVFGELQPRAKEIVEWLQSGSDLTQDMWMKWRSDESLTTDMGVMAQLYHHEILTEKM